MNTQEAKKIGATHYTLLRNKQAIENFFKQDERGKWYFWSNFNNWAYMVSLNDKGLDPEGIRPIGELFTTPSCSPLTKINIH